MMDNIEMKAYRRIANLRAKIMNEIADLETKLYARTIRLKELERDDAIKNEIDKMLERQRKREEKILKQEQEAIQNHIKEVRNEY